MSDFAKDTNVPANDCISRQAAIDAICSVCGADKECDKSKFVYDAPKGEQVIMCPDHYVLTHLPTVTPNKHIGEWTKAYDGNDGHVKCTACFKTYDYITQAKHFNYCPNCGARMVGWNE